MNDYRKLRKKLETLPVMCPKCRKETDSLKSYTFINYTFLLVTAKWGYEHHIACAKCMRKIILMTAAESLVNANIFWPFASLPLLSVNLTRTFVKGHSEDIINDLQLNAQQ